MYRYIVRYSLNGDNGTLGTYPRGLLTDGGFTRVGTAEFEGRDPSIVPLATVLAAFNEAIADPVNTFPTANIPTTVRIDHVWSYLSLID